MTPATTSAIVNSPTSSLFATDHSMIRFNMVASSSRHPVVSVRLRFRLAHGQRLGRAAHVHAGHVPHPAKRLPEIGLGVDEEGGRGDDGLARGEAAENLHALVTRD